jgi:rhodanese-related sulfurtransferase
MPVQLALRSLPPAAIKAMLDDGTELALIDVREELTFSQNHLLWARNVPLSRLELGFARLVPRPTTRIVLCDDNNGLARRAAGIVANAGYTDLPIWRVALPLGTPPDWYCSRAYTFQAKHSANLLNTTVGRPALAPASSML